MISRLQLIRNLGQFDSVASGANIPLARLTLIYAENGRGKTTLSAVMRSLATGDPIPIAERRRLAAQHPPQVVVECSGGPPPAIFQNNAWNRTLPNIVVFDDEFVDANVYSGLVVSPDHRQNLHGLILGAQGIALNNQLRERVAEIEVHSVELRARAGAIPEAERGAMSVDDFSALQPVVTIEADIQAAERNLAAVRQQDPVRNTGTFPILSLPPLDAAAIEQVLARDLPALDAHAAALVQAHLAQMQLGGEQWVAEGMRHLRTDRPPVPCPFCAQDVAGSPVIRHYRAYFSAAYAQLKGDVAAIRAAIEGQHGATAVAAFERSVRVAGERRHFWSQFADMPDTDLDTAAIERDWQTARQAVLDALDAKQAAPLEPVALSPDALAAMAGYEERRIAVANVNQRFPPANAAILGIKAQAAGNPQQLESVLTTLRTVRSRHTAPTTALCQAYLDEKSAKAQTEQLRDQAKTALERHRATAFPAYQTAINAYLQKFNAGFTIAEVTAVDNRGGPTCTYNVMINAVAVPVVGAPAAPGEPSFRNTLSAGDRSALALAFFFASMDQDPALADKIVVIDDPASSLDDHRSLTTVQEIRRLAGRTAQVVTLSHNKPLLCKLWDGADRIDRAALHVTRDAAGSTLAPWNVDQDSETENDKRHALLRGFIAGGAGDARATATALRPVIEAYLRVACPEYFPAGTLLGPFRGLCRARLGTPAEILTIQLLQELDDLTEYSNNFHHDTNAAWATVVINDHELRGFVTRVLRFTRP